MTKEYPSKKSERTDISPGNQAVSSVIMPSGFIRVWALPLKKGVISSFVICLTRELPGGDGDA